MPLELPPREPFRRTNLLWLYGRRLLIWLLVPYLLLHLLLITFQRQLIFHPTKTAPLSGHLAGAGLIDVQDVKLKISDELTLHGWYYERPATAETPARQLLIYFPGNSGTRSDRQEICLDLLRLGYNILIFDYQGYAENQGSPSEQHFASDAQAIWKFATTQLGYSPEKITLYGESMGGGVATRLAAELSEAKTPPAALILKSTYSSIPATARYHYPYLPLLSLFVWDPFASIDRIGKVTSPILQFHGTADRITPYYEAERLFAAAPAQSATGIAKQFVTIPEGGHNGLPEETLRREIQKLQALIAQPTTPSESSN